MFLRILYERSCASALSFVRRRRIQIPFNPFAVGRALAAVSSGEIVGFFRKGVEGVLDCSSGEFPELAVRGLLVECYDRGVSSVI